MTAGGGRGEWTPPGIHSPYDWFRVSGSLPAQPRGWIHAAAHLRPVSGHGHDGGVGPRIGRRVRGRDTPPIPLLRPFDSAQGERNAPPLRMDVPYFVSLPTQE